MDPQSCDAGGGGVFFHFAGDELATCLAALHAHEVYLTLLAEMSRGNRAEIREEQRATQVLYDRLLAAAADAGARLPH